MLNNKIGKAFLYMLLFYTTCAFGQMSTKNLVGRYGGTDGVCLFEDGQFLLYGYATAVFGRYTIKKDHIFFYPDKPDLFQLFGYNNPQIRGTYLTFVGFEEGETFARFDNDSTYRVFNEDANCFDPPFVKIRKNVPQSIALTAYTDQDSSAYENWYYANEAGYNDFLLIYSKPRQEYQDFIGQINGNALKLSNYGGDQGYPKNKEDREWDDIILMKKQYNESLARKDIVLVNKHYATFFVDLSEYRLDTINNQYVVNNPKDNEEYFENSPYQDNRYLRKYVKIYSRANDQEKLNLDKIGDSSLFYTVCDTVDGADSFKNADSAHEQLKTTEPVKVLPTNGGEHPKK